MRRKIKLRLPKRFLDGVHTDAIADFKNWVQRVEEGNSVDFIDAQGPWAFFRLREKT
tara:strand:- start:42751 stop:42921 length:171 start_codon:yes stop_codon:yes gene_type:complete